MMCPCIMEDNTAGMDWMTIESVNILQLLVKLVESYSSRQCQFHCSGR